MSSEQDQSPWKVGIIGTGFGSVVHYPSLKLHPAFEPVMIAGKSNIKTKQIASKLKVENYTTDWTELVENEEIDIVTIASPPDLHKEMTIRAVENGKHVLCEKPLALNLSEAQEIQDAAEESGQIAMLDLEFRYLPNRAYMIELINNEYIGEIYEVDISVRNSSRLNPRTKGYNWWSNAARGGGILNALGSHYIDFLNLIFDRVHTVAGRMTIHIPKRLNKMSGRMKKVTADDSFISYFGIDENCQATLQISTTTAFGRGSKIEVYGSEGSLILGEDQRLYGGKIGDDEHLKLLEIPKRHRLVTIEGEHILVPPFMRLLNDFQKSIQTGRSLHPNLEDGVKIQRIIDAIKESNKKSKLIRMDQKG